MDQKLTVKYKYASNHVVPVIHGALVTDAFSSNRIVLHLYNEHTDLPPEASVAIEDGKLKEESHVDTLVREVQVTLVLPLEVASVIGQAFNAFTSGAAGNVEQAGGTEDES